MNPNTDHHKWKELLKAAGVRDARLHDARHTAATGLLILGVSDAVVDLPRPQGHRRQGRRPLAGADRPAGSATS
nr:MULTISPECIES: hypothetical protein [unclassified Streptomyces]